MREIDREREEEEDNSLRQLPRQIFHSLLKDQLEAADNYTEHKTKLLKQPNKTFSFSVASVPTGGSHPLSMQTSNLRLTVSEILTARNPKLL